MAKFSNVIVNVPEEAIVSAGRVYIVTEKKYFGDRQYNMDKRVTIGWINDSSKKTMNPNSNYVARYPNEFSIAAKGKLAPVTKRCGLYMLSLALSHENGMYPTLVECCGPENANAIMDFANFSILSKSNVAKDYQNIMSDQMLYSEKLYSDTWLSELFEERLSESQQEDFKDKWAKACKDRGITKVWLCIDGSNSECFSKEVEIAEKGKSKTHKNCPICSYMYAVDAKTGTPITVRLYRGSRVDSKAFIEIQEYLRLYSIDVEGVILDRGFCDVDCLERILNQKLKYIIMMKENTSGFKTMYEKHANEIRMQSKHALGNGIYATTDECRMFGKYDHNSWITLVYDSKNGIERANYLFDKIHKMVQKLNESLKKGEVAKIDKATKAYVIPIEESGNIIRYEINHEKLQSAMDQKGFSAIASDSNYGPATTLEKYDLRDISEKQYMINKTQLGNKVFRSHYTNGVNAKVFVTFIASIVRHEMARICKVTGYELTVALREANFLCLQRTPDNTYMGVHNASKRQVALLAAANLKESDIDYFALEETRKTNQEIHDQIHKTPIQLSYSETGTNKRKPGRPKGTSNKESAVEIPKRKPGRPKGSKNKPKVEKTSIIGVVDEPNNDAKPIPKKRGRPPGSKNKKPALNAKLKRRSNDNGQSSN